MKGLILSGGRGTRLRPITHTGPKQLVPVANKPVIQYAIEELRDAGVTDIGVVLGNVGRDAIQSFLGDGSQFGVDITYIVQGNPLGLAHAVGCAQKFVGEDNFVMYLGDNILNDGITELVESFEVGDYAAGLALQQVDNPRQFGIATVDDDGDIVSLVEKPDDPPSDLAIIGVYVFSPAIFDAIDTIEPSERGELEITDAIQHLLEQNKAIDSHTVEGWWKDTGKPEDILSANRLVLDDVDASRDGTIENGAEVVGQVDMHKTAVIESGAVVRGPTSLAADVTIESGTYIGPYTSIGEHSRLANVQLSNSVVIGDSEITTDESIVDSLLGRGTTIGSSAEMLPDGQRLVVGENSKLRL
jgi:glucose-1-phosphate thymidylyltransferase